MAPFSSATLYSKVTENSFSRPRALLALPSDRIYISQQPLFLCTPDAACIEQVYSEDESWTATDFTADELKEFVEQMNTKQFKEVEQFFTTMPKLSHKVTVKNPKTKKESEVVLEGLASFFS